LHHLVELEVTFLVDFTHGVGKSTSGAVRELSFEYIRIDVSR
jgi:hypothetical protein